MSNYKRRGRFLVPVNEPSNTITGKHGSRVHRVGSNHGAAMYPTEAPKIDPVPGLLAELKGRKVN